MKNKPHTDLIGLQGNLERRVNKLPVVRVLDVFERGDEILRSADYVRGFKEKWRF